MFVARLLSAQSSPFPLSSFDQAQDIKETRSLVACKQDIPSRRTNDTHPIPKNKSEEERHKPRALAAAQPRIYHTPRPVTASAPADHDVDARAPIRTKPQKTRSETSKSS